MNTKYENTKINSKKMLLFVLIVFLFAVFWRFSKLLYFPDSQIELEKGEAKKVQPQETLMEKFTTDRDGLAKMEILLRSPGVKFENGDKMEMKLMDETCEKTVRQGELEKSFLASDNLFEFTFERVPDSAGKTFCLKAQFLPKKDSARAIQFFTRDIENRPLSLRPVYKNENVWKDIEELNQRMSQYKPWFFKENYLYFIGFGFLVLSIVIILVLILAI